MIPPKSAKRTHGVYLFKSKLPSRTLQKSSSKTIKSTFQYNTFINFQDIFESKVTSDKSFLFQHSNYSIGTRYTFKRRNRDTIEYSNNFGFKLLFKTHKGHLDRVIFSIPTQHVLYKNICKASKFVSLPQHCFFPAYNVLNISSRVFDSDVNDNDHYPILERKYVWDKFIAKDFKHYLNPEATTLFNTSVNSDTTSKNQPDISVLSSFLSDAYNACTFKFLFSDRSFPKFETVKITPIMRKLTGENFQIKVGDQELPSLPHTYSITFKSLSTNLEPEKSEPEKSMCITVDEKGKLLSILTNTTEILKNSFGQKIPQKNTLLLPPWYFGSIDYELI